MKKHFIMMMAVMVSFAFISCEKNPESNDDEIGKHDPTSDADQIEVTGYNGLEWFQNSIVVLDESGKPIRRVNGEMLDPSDTTILSVCVSDLKMAEDLFLSWVAPEKDVNKVNGGYDYNLTDYDDTPQGSVSFRNADGSQGILATVTVGTNTDLKCFSEINFVNDQAWPENSNNVKYETGKTYVIRAQALAMDYCPAQPDPDLEMTLLCMMPYTTDLTFFCIQGNTDGKEAILVYLSPDVNDQMAHGHPYDYTEWNAHKHCASLPEAEKVLKYYTENYESWEAMIDYMESLGHAWDWHLGWETTGNEEFILNSYDEKSGTIKVLDLDTKEGKIEDVDLDSWFNYRYIFVRTFPPYIGE
jgi:hypothetical protein